MRSGHELQEILGEVSCIMEALVCRVQPFASIRGEKRGGYDYFRVIVNFNPASATCAPRRGGRYQGFAWSGSRDRVSIRVTLHHGNLEEVIVQSPRLAGRGCLRSVVP